MFAAATWGKPAHAQRTMSGQNMITLYGFTPFTGSSDLGGELCWGRYQMNSYWKVKADAESSSHRLKTGHTMNACTVTLGSSYMHRLACTRSRNVSLYAGGGVFIGYEIYDPLKKLPKYINTGLPAGNFLYGINANIEGEFFILKRLALVVYAELPVNFSSPLSKVRYRAGAGIRINL
jgi:hypothetical protein